MNAQTGEKLYDRSFAAATASQTCFVLANTLVAHYARWVEFLGGDLEDVGWVTGLGTVCSLLLRPWMGQWINRVGARVMWAVGYFVFTCGSLGNLLLHELSWQVYFYRSCLSLGAALVFASSLTYITQTTPPQRRTEAIGILGVGGFLGMLCGPHLGDVILSASERSRGDFVLLFLTAAGVLAIPTVLLFYMRPTEPTASRSSANLRKGSTPGPTTSRRGPVSLGQFVATVIHFWPGTILLMHLAFGVAMTVPFVFLYSYVDRAQLKLDGFFVDVIGLFFLCYAGWGITVRVVLRRLPDRVGRRKVLLVGMIFMSLGMFCFPIALPENAGQAGHAGGAFWIMVPALILGTGHALIFHTMTSLSLESFPSEVRGSGSALSLMMLDLGTTAGAPILGIIAEQAGFGWLFWTIGIVCLTAGVAYTLSSVPVWQSRRIAG